MHTCAHGFPRSSVSKASACNEGNQGLIPGWGRSSGEGNGSPLQYSCLENPMDRGAQQATIHEVTRVRHDLATKPPTPVSIAALFTIAKTWNQSEKLSTGEWIKKMQYIYSVEYYSTIKRMVCSHLQQHGCSQRKSD